MGGLKLGFAVERAANGKRLTVLVGHLKRHSALKTLDERASLGEELAEELVFLYKRSLTLGAGVHVFAIIVACLTGTAIHGNHTTVQVFPIAVIVGGHLIIVEQGAIVAGIRT